MAYEKRVSLSLDEQVLAIKTWRYLRVAIVLLVVGLAFAIGYQFFHASCKCFLTSISAYYYTPVHAYFVGALVSIGVCLFCIKGNTEGEDILLNLAGLFAPVVAFVPTPDEDHAASVLYSAKEIEASVTNNMTALFALGAIGLIFGAWLSRRNRPPRQAQIGYAVAVAAYVAAVVWFLVDRSGFITNEYLNGHFVAAVLMFICIIAVVWLNAVGYKGKSGAESVRNRYFAIAVAMVSSVVTVGIAAVAGFEHWLLVLEALLIVLFAVFWFIQTVELWHEGLR